MSTLEVLSTRAFTGGRAGLATLKAPGGALLSFADVPTLRFATGVGVSARSDQGRPKPASCSWSEFCEGVISYAEVVVGPDESSKRLASAYVLAGELRRGLQGPGQGGPVLGPTVAALSTAAPTRNDGALASLTMLIVDCDAPAPHRRLCRELAALSIAYCVAPTWSATPEQPKWRLFIPIAPLPVDNSTRGRAEARLRYSWLCGMLAELGDMPVECLMCARAGEQPKPGPPSPVAPSPSPRRGPKIRCALCGDTQTFRFDPSCWNYSRLHFLGGLKTADQDMTGREVVWGKGLALDCESWLAGSGWGAFWANAWTQLESEMYSVVGSPVSVDGSIEPAITDDELHPDPLLADAIGRCSVGLLERVRRAAQYIGSPNFPAAVAGQGGETQVMRACAIILSGFLVPLGSENTESNWAQRILDVCYKPRCNPRWDDKYIARKLRQVRVVPGQVCGGLLSGSGQAGREQRFYIVEGKAYDSGGNVLTLGRGLQALLIDAARLCAVRSYDPCVVPEGFVVRGPPIGPGPGLPDGLRRKGV